MFALPSRTRPPRSGSSPPVVGYSVSTSTSLTYSHCPQLADAGLAHRSIRNVRAVLRAALNQAMRYGYVLRNVATLVDVPGRVTFTATPLDQAQVQRFLEALQNHRWAILFRFALGLGLRKGELLGLRWEDVQLAAATIRITGSLQRQNGRLERSTTKTDASIRTIALPPGLLALLQQHQAQQEEERCYARRWEERGLVFTTSVGTAIEPGDLSKQFKQILVQAGLPTTIRFHDLRHSCATLLITQGVHPRVVMDILGHAQIATTMNIYGHVLPEVQREAITMLDRLFTEPPGGTSPLPEAAAPAANASRLVSG